MPTAPDSSSHLRTSGSAEHSESATISSSKELNSPLSPDFEGGSYNSSVALLERYQDTTERPRKDVGTIVILLLTVSNFGIQGVWSTLMSHGTLYLHTLGLSPTLTAVVWLAGPLSGALFQPLIGAHSDRCSSKWGRRKPYIIGGTIGTIICLLALATVQEFVTVLYNIVSRKSTRNHEALVKTLAVFWVYALNLAIQPLQAGVRAFIVDNCPAHQQVEASGWVSRFNSFGSVVFFFLGSRSLPSWLGNTQFMALSIIASSVLAIVIPLSFTLGRDKVLFGDHVVSEKVRTKPTSIFRTLVSSARSMPPRSRTVCKVQFFAWLGWFPFLYYNTM
jgi:solute carrier family 45 protein 1/2/4